MMSHSPALRVEVGKYSMLTLLIDIALDGITFTSSSGGGRKVLFVNFDDRFYLKSKWHKFLWGQLFLFCLIGQYMR